MSTGDQTPASRNSAHTVNPSRPGSITSSTIASYETTRAIHNAIAMTKQKPRAWVNASAIGYYGEWSSQYTAASVLDHQNGIINEPNQDGSYWLNSDNGPANAYIVIDLGAAFHLASIDLFNTHNAFYGDRGTGAATT